jgi:hypothetical protein
MIQNSFRNCSRRAAETMAVLAEYNSINDLFGLEENYSDPDKMDKLMDRQGFTRQN